MLEGYIISAWALALFVSIIRAMREPRCVERTMMVPRFFCVRIFHLAAQSWAATDLTQMSVPADVVIPGKVNPIPCTGLASDATPETLATSFSSMSSQNGESTKNTLSARVLDEDRLTINEQKEQNPPTPNSSPLTAPRSPFTVPHWYALRTTYGRERQAYEYITSHGGTAYWPTIEVVKEIDGKRKTLRASRIPNILFAYGTQQELQEFVYDNVNLPFLRFYYCVETIGREKVRRPLTVPERQMESLRIICAVDDGNIALVPQADTHFSKGQHVRITQGRFSGVTGRVARYQGQQRVAVIIEGLFTIATAYIPSAFLEPLTAPDHK